MSHYFIEDTRLPHDPRTITYRFADNRYVFTTDAGVFSKDQVDHASDLLIRNLPALQGSLLDLGCGYGCIGIVLAKAYGLVLTQADVNPAAVRLAAANCALNQVVSTTLVSDGFANIPGRFDTITLNPPIHAGKGTIYSLYEDARTHLHDNGVLYVVIHKKHGADSTLSKLSALYRRCEVIYRKKGIFILSCAG